MGTLGTAFGEALRLVSTLDAGLVEIVVLSLRVTLTAVGLATLIGVPLGALLAVTRFPGRTATTLIVNALMGLPPVVAGLLVYLLISNSGPLGVLQLLYTPAAMIIAQTVLVAPIVAALTRETVEGLHGEYDEQLRAMGARPSRLAPTLVWEGRFAILTAILAGLGRAIAEVGAVMIVGGNIDHVTRTMTTAIALETSKGDLSLALALGLILLLIALALNAATLALKVTAQHAATARDRPC